MILLSAVLAVASLAGGAACLYLATPHQRLLARPLAPRVGRLVGLAGLAAALAILLGVMGPATAVFTWATGLMALWTIAPVAIGWRRHRKEGRP